MKEITKDKILLKIARLMPKCIVKWCAVRLMAHATSGKYGNQDVTKLDIITALKRWETENGKVKGISA